MKKLIRYGIITSIILILSTNAYAMDSLLVKINTIIPQVPLTKATIESALHIKFHINQKASNPSMKIYECNLLPVVHPYSNIELRVFSGGEKFFLIIYPAKPVNVSQEELKKLYPYKDFTIADETRGELAGYHFEKDGKAIIFYYDNRNCVKMVTIDGKFKDN